jgi:hypothetical protein
MNIFNRLKRTIFTSINTLTVLIAIFSVVAATAVAQADWLQKGKDLLKGWQKDDASSAQLTTEDMGAGLKEALRVGTQTVVSQLGTVDGFNADPSIHIPLPETLDKVQSALNKVGAGGMLDDLELRLNRAAEQATPKAKALFLQAINEMTLEDVKGIYKGPDDAATRYFRAKMSVPLAGEMRPIVNQSLAEVGAVQVYDKTMARYRALPFIPDVNADLTNFVIEKGLDGIFYYLAREEAAIRNEPVKRTTDILKRVFGAG